MNNQIAQKLASLPELPGSYQYLDETGKIIYVGKAKNLKNRVKTYFTGSHDAKTTRLVSQIVDMTYLVTSTETEAFLLELSLIKEHRPKYNIMLMDDKTYPYIEVTSETHPKLVIIRKISKKNKTIFGPFPNASAARETMELLGRIFPLRKCAQMPKKVCLYYHMGQCMGPCVYPVSALSYEPILTGIRQFFAGNDTLILKNLEQKMQDAASKLEFEKAQEYKQLLQAVQDTTARQKVMFTDHSDRDIINYYADEVHMTVTFLFMRQGRIIFGESKIFEYYQTVQDAFFDYIAQFYAKNPLPTSVMVPDDFDYTVLADLLEGTLMVPKKGDKAKLVHLAKENAILHHQNNMDAFLRKVKKTTGAMSELATLLGLEEIRRIEAFDNSHTMGSNQVSAMVVFIDGSPENKSYRKYLNKTAGKADDYHQMQEVIYRRYQRLLVENGVGRPDLIVMDGGIAQVHAAKEILDSLYLDIPVIGLKKDDFHKTDAIIGLDETAIKLDRHSDLYILLTKIQDEAHRFAITFHREKQGKQIYASMLDAVPGIGAVSKQKLLETFKTLDNIKKAEDDALKAIGLKKPQIENLRIALMGKTVQEKK